MELRDGVADFSAFTNGRYDSTTPATNLTTKDFVVSSFLKDFTLLKSSSDLSIRLTATITSPTTITSTISSNSTVRAASYYIYYFNEAQFEFTHISYLDSGFIRGENSVTSVDFNQL